MRLLEKFGRAPASRLWSHIHNIIIIIIITTTLIIIITNKGSGQMSKCNLCAFIIICRSQMHLQGLSSNWSLFRDATSEFRMIEQKHLSKKMCISPKCLKRLLASTAALATISPPAGWFSLLHPSPRFPLKIDSYD